MQENGEPRKTLAVQASHYSAGNFLTLLAGFVTFPLLTRTLTVADYGLLSFVSLVLSLLVGIGKIGLQQSIVRFFNEVRMGKRPETTEGYYGTVIPSLLAAGLAFSAIWILVTEFTPAHWWSNPNVHFLLLLTTPLILVRIFESAFTNILRAQERSRDLNIYNVAKRYASLAAVVVTVLYIARTAAGFFSATITAEVISLSALVTWFLRRQPVRLQKFSPSLFRAMLAFGLPMVVTEVSWVIFASGDRYVIQILLGAGAVGVYSAAYNICDYVQTSILAALISAMQPIFIRIYEESGAPQAVAFLRTFVHSYFLIAAPIVAGFSAICEPLLTTLASDKYRAGAALIPWIIGGMVFAGVSIIGGSGLYTHKRSSVTMTLILISAVVNIALNLFLVPRYGILGSAIATLLSYMLLATLMYWTGRRYLAVPMPWLAIGRSALLAAIMYLVITRIGAVNAIVTIGLRVGAGVLLYGTLVYFFDRLARDWIRRHARILRQRFRASADEASRPGAPLP